MDTRDAGKQELGAIDDDAFGQVRPRLRHDVLFADTGDGVFLKTAESQSVVKGRSAYRLLAALSPFLTGERTVAQLADQLPEAQRGMVRSFVSLLVDRGFARDAELPRPADLSAQVRTRFRSQINYVEHHTDHAAARFARFRAAEVLVVGSGAMARAAALALLRNGMAAVAMAPAVAAPGALPPELTAEAEGLTRAGCAATVRWLGLPVDALDEKQLRRYAVVIAPAEDVGAAQVLRLSRLRAPEGPVLLPAFVVGDLAVLGPLAREDGTPCWVCALLRLHANLDSEDVAALWRELSLPGLATTIRAPSAPLAAMLGNLMGYDVFRLLTGCLPAESEGAIVVQHLDTLEALRERLLPHPLCPVCAAAAEQPRGAPPQPSAPGLEGDEYRDLLGRYAGVLRAFEDGGIDQSPLKVGRVTFGAPGTAEGTARSITAFDLHTVLAARSRALRAAALVYVGLVAASPRPQTGEVRGAVAHDRLATWSGLPAEDQRATAWLPATSLLSQEERAVPAAAVHPFAGVNAASVFERTGAGAGAGADADAAITAGLLSAMAYEALRDAAAGRLTGRVLPLEVGDPDPALDFLARTARNLDVPVEVLDISAPSSIEVALVRTCGDDGGLWALGWGFSRRSATIEALLDLLGRVQMRRQTGDTGVVLGEPLLPELEVAVLKVAERAMTAPVTATTVSEVLEGLRSSGREALVVDTTTPDLLLRGGIVTVRVLIARLPG